MARVFLAHRPTEFLSTLVEYLRAARHEVIAHSRGEKAAQEILRARPHVAILDAHLPRFTGLEIHECLLSTDRGRGIPVIHLSDDANPVLKDVAEELGALAFLVTPVELRVIKELIEQIAPRAVPEERAGAGRDAMSVQDWLKNAAAVERVRV